MYTNKASIDKIVTKLNESKKMETIETLHQTEVLYNLFHRLAFHFHKKCMDHQGDVDIFLEELD